MFICGGGGGEREMFKYIIMIFEHIKKLSKLFLLLLSFDDGSRMA